MTHITNTVQQTEALGDALARQLPAGTVLAFTGDLGAGKTAFTRGLARGLGIPDRVTSPTYTIVNQYEGGRLPLFHFDLYRLGDAEELYDIGWEDYLAQNGICAVEWSERCPDLLEQTVTVRICRGETDDQRIITITGEGIALEAFGH